MKYSGGKIRVGLVGSGLLIAGAVGLAGCSADDSAALFDPQWQIPLHLGQAYETTHFVPLVDFGDSVMVSVADSVAGYELPSGNMQWSLTLDGVSSCQRAGNYALCPQHSQRAVAIDRQGNTSIKTGLVVEGSDDTTVYFARSSTDRVELVAQPIDISLDQMGMTGEVLAVYDGTSSKLPDGTEITRDVSGHYPAAVEDLLARGILTRNSAWLNPPPVTHVAQPIADGFVVISGGGVTGTEVEPTTISLYDVAGNEAGKHVVDAALHMSVNPRWTLAELNDIAQQVTQLGKPHAFVFDDGHVIGFDVRFHSAVAPAYANYKEFALSNAESLAMDNIHPETLSMWVKKYPYVSITGKNDDGVVARTYNVQTGEVLVDKEKCQWTDQSVYCFDATHLAKPQLAVQQKN
ncbi:hypothetical protein [Trueperella sp. LYQ143]|uniref:hypothetical protein n=1 Tax=unclassified Trueperella TaxID=2630174 RepID=UPI003982E015